MHYYRSNPETCSPCGGLGYIITGPSCTWCKGTGEVRIRCSECNDPHRSQPLESPSGACTRCNGLGYNPEKFIPEKPCDGCIPYGPAGSMAAAKIPGKCEYCKGSGKQKSFTNEEYNCIVCKGTGVCSRCQGTLRLPAKVIPKQECFFCRQTGRCRKCGGTGIITCEAALYSNFHEPCPRCGICQHCKGRRVANQDCWKCKGSGQQQTKEEMHAAWIESAKKEHRQCLRNLQLHNIENIEVNLFAGRRETPQPPSPDMPLNPWTSYSFLADRYDKDMEQFQQVPEFQTHLLIAENVPIYTALFIPDNYLTQTCRDYGYPKAVFSTWFDVYHGERSIGQLRDTYGVAHFIYTGGGVKELLVVAALTGLGKYEDILDISWASRAEEQAKDLAMHTRLEEDTVHSHYFEDWREILKPLPLGRSSDSHLVILNDVRQLAFKLYRGVQVKRYNYSY